MIHGADPWWDIAIRLMIKYRNLRLMTSAWSRNVCGVAPSTTSRRGGSDRILFASDYPVLSMQRADEARALDLTPGPRRLALRQCRDVLPQRLASRA
jgi:predicted TIM-barrel fold metal-dependent hydrolase